MTIGQVEIPTLDALLAETDAAIEKAHEMRREVVENLRRIDEHLRRLTAARKAMVADRKAARKRKPSARPKQSPRERTALQHAGQGNVERVREYLAAGPATKATITRALGVNNGTITYALRHLEESGEARTTGRKEGRSEEFELVRNGRRVTRPGDRR